MVRLPRLPAIAIRTCNADGTYYYGLRIHPLPDTATARSAKGAQRSNYEVRTANHLLFLLTSAAVDLAYVGRWTEPAGYARRRIH
jgi:hypothetical protein